MTVRFLKHGVLFPNAEGNAAFVATTARGELLLFDDAGTLRWGGETPEADPDDRVATYQIAAGEIGPGAYGVLIRHLHDGYLYRLDLEALKTSSED